MKQMAIFFTVLLILNNYALSLESNGEDLNLKNLEEPVIVRKNEDLIISMKKPANNNIVEAVRNTDELIEKKAEFENLENGIKRLESNKETSNEVLVKNIEDMKAASIKLGNYLDSSDQGIKSIFNMIDLKIKEMNEIDKNIKAIHSEYKSNEKDSNILLKSLENEKSIVDSVINKMSNQNKSLEAFNRKAENLKTKAALKPICKEIKDKCLGIVNNDKKNEAITGEKRIKLLHLAEIECQKLKLDEVKKNMSEEKLKLIDHLTKTIWPQIISDQYKSETTKKWQKRIFEKLQPLLPSEKTLINNKWKKRIFEKLEPLLPSEKALINNKWKKSIYSRIMKEIKKNEDFPQRKGKPHKSTKK